MEILDTSSKQCKILIQDGKKYVIRYPRTIGKTVEYFCEITYWNYEKLPFHLTKYTSLPTSIGFAGIIEFFMEYLMEPILNKVQQLPKTTLQILAVGFFILLMGDFLISFRSMYLNKKPNYLWKYDITQNHFIYYPRVK